MKKQIVSLLALALVGGTVIASPATKDAKAANVGTYAEYVSVEYAPVIDGQIDDVWSTAISNIDVVNFGSNPEEAGDAYGEVSILWNETGLYFLAQVTDPNVNITDRCNFWVSETPCAALEGYPFVDGAYFLCISSNNTIYDYRDPSLFRGESGHPEIYQTATSETDIGYVVEAYVPLTGSTALELGNVIGFDCSIDNFVVANTVREGYRFWAGLGAYWETPSALASILLADTILENGTPSNATSPNGPTNDPEDKKESSSSGCKSSIEFSMLGSVMLVGFVLLKKKK